MKKNVLLLLLALTLILTACTSATQETDTIEGDTIAELEESVGEDSQTEAGILAPEDILTLDFDNAASLRNQLALGILALQDTPQAVTPEQAAELLPLWQAMYALEQAETTAQAEIEALQTQMLRGMSGNQLQSIAALKLTNDDLAEFYADFGIAMGSDTEETQGMQGANKDMSEEEREAFRATRQASEAGDSSVTAGSGRERRSLLTNEVIGLLTDLINK